MHEWGGAPMQRLLAYARAVVDDATVDREGNRRKITWRINFDPRGVAPVMYAP